MLRAVRGNINADFRHDFHGERVDVARRIGAGALDIREIAERGAQKTFADMAAAGVARAEDEDGGFHYFWGNIEHSTFNAEHRTINRGVDI
jgi:hypothetical protein